MNVINMATEPTAMSSLVGMLPIILAFGGLFWFMNRSEKKRQKEAQELINSMDVGDEIVTIGGIISRIVKVEEETQTLLVESGPDRTKMRIQRSAVGANNSALERKEAEKEAKQEEREKGKKK